MKRILQIFRTDFKIYRNRVRIIQLHGWVICQCKDASGGLPGRIRAADVNPGGRGVGASHVSGIRALVLIRPVRMSGSDWVRYAWNGPVSFKRFYKKILKAYMHYILICKIIN